MHRLRLSAGDRLRIVFFHEEMHLTQLKIARRMKCSQSTVSYVLSHHRHHVKAAQHATRGRPPKFDSHMIEHMRNMVRHNRQATSSELARHFFHHDNIDITSRAIRYYRRQYFHTAHERIIPRLTLEHHLDRVDYCLTHVNNNFHCVVFTDEKMWCLDHTSSTVWIEDDEEIPLREVASIRTKVMVWGAVWYNGRSELCIVEGTVNQHSYIDILSRYLLPSMPSSPRFRFQQDNAKPHVAPRVCKFLYDYAVPVLEPWPAHSPDFSAIEKVWAWMVCYVNGRRPKDRQTLIAAIQQAWDAIPQYVVLSHMSCTYCTQQQYILADRHIRF